MKLFRQTALLIATAGIPSISFSQTTEYSQPAQKIEIEEAKLDIVKIVTENMDRIDNFKEVREQLNPLVNYLSQFKPTDERSLSDKIGTWKQLWTDDADDLRANNAFQKADRNRTYQVVFEDGIFYNLTEIKTPVGRFSGFLRGVYEKEGESLSLEFTKIRLKRGNLGPEKEILDLTRRFESGELKGTFKIPFGSDKYPNGPVGATGKIRTVYIDKDLRIDIGSNDADGVEDLFVLVRI